MVFGELGGVQVAGNVFARGKGAVEIVVFDVVQMVVGFSFLFENHGGSRGEDFVFHQLAGGEHFVEIQKQIPFFALAKIGTPAAFHQLVHGGAVGEDFAVARGNEDADVRLRVHFFNLRGVGGVDNGVADGGAQRLDEHGADVVEIEIGAGFFVSEQAYDKCFF